jgi:MFS transporter, PPP family, 3-phenylpropionic acid transporter
MTARSFSIRFSATFAFLMVGAGVQLPFLPLWLHSQGFSAPDIALVLASMMVSRAIASPLVSYAADHYSNRVLVIRICAALALVAFACLVLARGFGQVYAAACAGAFLFAAVFPLAEGYSIEGSVRHGLDYGRLRLWASLSFLVGNLGAGALLTRLQPGDTLWLIIAGQASAVFATGLLPRESKALAHKFMADVQEPGGLGALLKSRAMLAILVVSLGMSSHAMLNGFSSVYWTAHGFSPINISFMWVAAVMMEVGFFAFSRRVMERFGYRSLICIGLGSGIVRWCGMGLFTSFWVTMGLQGLHAFSFATLHLGMMHLLQREVPANLRNTAQGTYSAVSGGVFMAAMTWLSGQLYNRFEGYAFFCMALVSAAALLFALVLFGFTPKGRAVPVL